MSYQTLENLPQDVKEMPQGAQQMFMAAFNSAESDGLSQDGATKVAWNSVLSEYEKDANGHWHNKPDVRADHGPLGNLQGA